VLPVSLEKQPAKALVGTVLDGAYRIEGLVDMGGMGAVYEATHLRLGNRVAVKVMARELAANPEALARFHREAVITSGLGHPHIVQVFDFSTTPTGEPFLVMEFLQGEDLDHRIRRVGRLPTAEVVHIIKQVASALAATHAKAIIHRDLKPANIYLLEVAGETDFVKVLDFGISKIRAATTKITRSAALMGTPNYMSPEQALGKVDDLDERTDQWALACITWECLSSTGPFVGENVPSLLFQVVHEPPPALLPRVAGLPPQVEEVLLRALSKNRNDRFASVNDFAIALEGAVAGTTPVAPSSAPRTVQLPHPLRDTRSLPSTFTRTADELDNAPDVPPSRARWFWALAVCASLALLLGAFLFFRPKPAPKPVIAGPAPMAPALPALAPPAVPPPSPAPAVAPLPPVPSPAPAAALPEANEPEADVSAKTVPSVPEAKHKGHRAGEQAAGKAKNPVAPRTKNFDDPFYPQPTGKNAPLEETDRQPKAPHSPEQRSKESEDKWRVD
jgi:serine/threonine-protein kinase